MSNTSENKDASPGREVGQEKVREMRFGSDGGEVERFGDDGGEINCHSCGSPIYERESQETEQQRLVTDGGEVPCPYDECGNEDLDRMEDDPEYDYFCHWCGNLFEAEEVENAQ